MKTFISTTLGWLLTLCFISMTFVSRFLDNIMFVDGIIYAAISRNMATGKGAFWSPHFLINVWPEYNKCSFFCDHPPLMFLLESCLFRLLPDESLVENIYNLLVLISIVLLIVWLWRMLFQNHPELIAYSWLPVICWYGIRTVWWSVPNNLLDTTMTIFCLLSCLMQLYAIFSHNTLRALLFWFLSATFILLAFLTKGPIGLYPLTFAAIYSLTTYRVLNLTAFKGSLIMLAVIAIQFIFLLSHDQANTFIIGYMEGQVIQSLLMKRENLGDSWQSHVFLLKILSKDLMPHFLISISLFLLSRTMLSMNRISFQIKNVCLITLVVAISGILPILISKKQGASYMMPALPFLGLFFASCWVVRINYIIKKHNYKSSFLIILTSVLCIIVSIHTYKNSERSYLTFSLGDIGKFVPVNRELGVSRAFYNDSYVPAYLQRFHQISPTLDWKDKEYVLADSTNLKIPTLFLNRKLIWKDPSGIYSLYKYIKQKRGHSK